VERTGFLPLARRWWWVLALGAVVAAASANVLASRLAPTYEAEVSLLTGPLNTGFDTLRASGDLGRTYAQLATSGPILRATMEELGVERPVEDLREDVTATSNDVTRLVTIRVKDGDPARAAETANAIAEQLTQLVRQSPRQELEIVDEFMRQTEIESLSDRAELRVREAAERVFGAEPPAGRLQVVDPAAAPPEPVAPRVTLITVLAGLGGLVMAGIFALFRESSADSVESEQVLVEAAGIPFLGSVNSLGRRKSSDPLVVESRPGSPAATAYRLLAARIGLFDNETSIRSLLVIGTDESDGSGLLAANLAAVLAESDWHATLVDANTAEGEISAALGLSDQPGYGELVLGGESSNGNAPALDDVRVRRTEDLDVIPRGTAVSDAMVEGERVREVLDGLLQSTDVVILSAPPVERSPSTLVWARTADATILVARRGRTSRETVSRAVDALRQARAKLVGTVLTEGSSLPFR
jgi:capsular polysaccharide biosynthesis protein